MFAGSSCAPFRARCAFRPAVPLTRLRGRRGGTGFDRARGFGAAVHGAKADRFPNGGLSSVLGEAVPGNGPSPLVVRSRNIVRTRWGAPSWIALAGSSTCSPRHRDYWRAAPRPEEWLLVEWRAGEPEPTRYWLATLPETTRLRALVSLAKLRWCIERDYQDLKQELGLGNYEGRGWRGFHHHATLCIAAYGFLIAERATIPPSAEWRPPPLSAPALPQGYRSRGTAGPAGTSRRHRPGSVSSESARMIGVSPFPPRPCK